MPVAMLSHRRYHEREGSSGISRLGHMGTGMAAASSSSRTAAIPARFCAVALYRPKAHPKETG